MRNIQPEPVQTHKNAFGIEEKSKVYTARCKIVYMYSVIFYALLPLLYDYEFI